MRRKAQENVKRIKTKNNEMKNASKGEGTADGTTLITLPADGLAQSLHPVLA